jgi:arsenate reductase
MKTKIFHNPQCSKSRQTLALLLDKGIKPEIIDYLKTPPDRKALQNILKMLGMKPIDLIRKREALYKELELGKHADNTQMLLDVMIENPILIERPIVISNNKAVIGRPPELVLDII